MSFFSQIYDTFNRSYSYSYGQQLYINVYNENILRFTFPERNYFIL